MHSRSAYGPCGFFIRANPIHTSCQVAMIDVYVNVNYIFPFHSHFFGAFDV